MKSSADMVKAIEPAVRFDERPPAEGLDVETPYATTSGSAPRSRPRRSTPYPGTPQAWNTELVETFSRAWRSWP
ncbi:hypothetical protein [Pseudarthrobacter sp. AB1]|uniref:hypothetical protein n=1 Tax=Pseudarthrobacter sp. AB1 TaxID=2138309 RepID=UPI00186BAAE4|nr:hypothetical protein [Pseudarthrobacter sp. AB1]